MIAFVLGLVLGLLLAAGISQAAGALTSGQPSAQASLVPAAAMHQIDLPDPAFTGMVLGYGTDFQPEEAARLAGIAVDMICPQLVKGFTYQSIREGLEVVYGFSHGEAGLLISATRLYECE